MPNGGRMIPSTSSQPSAVLILKDAALQPVAAIAGGVPCSFRRLRFMPGCTVRPTDARFCRSVPKCPAPSTLLRDRTEPGSACQRPCCPRSIDESLPFLVGGLNWIHLYNCLTVQQAALPMAIDSAAHRPVRHVPVYLAGSGERQFGVPSPKPRNFWNLCRSII